MSQTLGDLLRPHIKDDESTAFLEKSLSPSAALMAQQVPDDNALPSTVIHSQVSEVITPPAGHDPTKPWSFAIISLPVAGCPALLRKDGVNASNGTGIIEYDELPEGSPVLNAALSSESAGTTYRITAKSITIDQDATATTNKGTVYAADVRNSWARSTGTLTGGTNAAYATYHWRGLSTAYLAAPSVLSTMPGAVTWKASQGMYMISRNEGSFQWARADRAYVQTPTGAGTNGSKIESTVWEPCMDWSIPVVVFTNLDASAQYPYKLITCYEIIPELGSILQDSSSISATNLPAVVLYKTLSRKFGQFYPADFNDWGTLWENVKRVFRVTRPLIAGAASMIPGAGPLFAAAINAIPVESKEKQQAAQRKQAEDVQRSASTESAVLRVAARQLADNKTPGQPVAVVPRRTIKFVTKPRAKLVKTTQATKDKKKKKK